MRFAAGSRIPSTSAARSGSSTPANVAAINNRLNQVGYNGESIATGGFTSDNSRSAGGLRLLF